ncbi:MAG: hypothetical protein ACE5KZ_16475, partial [Candidatus Scalinduaceae bacterium]
MTTAGESEVRTNTDKAVSRRRFFYLLGWGFIGVYTTATLGAVIRFFFPRILYEPHRRNKADYPFKY